MNEISYRKTTKDDMEILMKLRLEMLREVNDLSGEYEYDEKFISESRRYFESGEQTTVIALDGQTPVGCASLSYIWIMPTFSHPTGNRAHLMNVYTLRQATKQTAISRNCTIRQLFPANSPARADSAESPAKMIATRMNIAAVFTFSALLIRVLTRLAMLPSIFSENAPCII